jgi:phosphoglycerol transferase MdoB-like AlkP superfamily enzyme
MGILAVIMFDSVRGLNPLLLVCSIASVFLQYWGLVLLFYAIFFLYYFLIAGSAAVAMATGSIIGMLGHIVISRVIFLWMLLISAHLLGRFYWRYEDKLRWEV